MDEGYIKYDCNWILSDEITPQQIEEINESDIMNEHKYIPVDTDRINKYKERLFLKRSKPINAHETTLDHTMNLKFGQS